MRVNITATNVGQVVRALRKAQTMYDDTRPLMVQVAGVMQTETDEAFMREQTPDHKRWAPLALSTTRALISGKLRGAHPILQVSGQLVASIHTKSGNGFAEIGTNKVQAALQQFGGAAGRGHAAQVPARAYIGLGQSALQNILALANKFAELRLPSAP